MSDARTWEVRVWRDPNMGLLDRMALGGCWWWTASPTYLFSPINECGRGNARTKAKAQEKADRWIASIESSYEVRTSGGND